MPFRRVGVGEGCKREAWLHLSSSSVLRVNIWVVYKSNCGGIRVSQTSRNQPAFWCVIEASLCLGLICPSLKFHNVLCLHKASCGHTVPIYGMNEKKERNFERFLKITELLKAWKWTLTICLDPSYPILMPLVLRPKPFARAITIWRLRAYVKGGLISELPMRAFSQQSPISPANLFVPCS